MSTAYVGNAENVEVPARQNISATTDATPIVVTTAGIHGYLDDEIVEVVDHAVNVTANRTWGINVLTLTTFQLVGSVGAGAGAGGATGTVRALASRPEIPIPDGSDPASAATWNVPYETIADQLASLSARAGQYGIASLGSAVIDDDTFSAAWSVDATGAAGVWTENRKNAAGVVGHGFTELLGAGCILDVTYDARDWIDAVVSIGRITTTADTDFCLFLHLYDPGVVSTFAASTRVVGGAIHVLGSFDGPILLRGRRLIAGTRGKKARVYLAAKSAAGGDVYTLAGDSELLVTVCRSASVLP